MTQQTNLYNEVLGKANEVREYIETMVCPAEFNSKGEKLFNQRKNEALEMLANPNDALDHIGFVNLSTAPTMVTEIRQMPNTLSVKPQGDKIDRDNREAHRQRRREE